MTSSPISSPGQSPFAGYPDADGSSVLYATHSGAVPGPVERDQPGPDPYLATRTRRRLGRPTTSACPSDINPAAGSFSSVLGEADAALEHLRLRRPEPLQPLLHERGLETGIPVRLADGQLVQGMAGSLDPGVAPREAGRQGREVLLSADGRHLIFASKYAFEPGANNNGADLTVYDRDLTAGTTQIVSHGSERRRPHRRRHLRARPLHRRLAGRDGNQSLGQIRRATNTSIPTCTSATRRTASTSLPAPPRASSTPG